MAGTRIAVRAAPAAAALALLAPAGAQAGTYDVVSCRAPGADGINRAWTVGYGAYPSHDLAQPEKFDVVQECPGARTFLLARSTARDGIDAGWARSAFLRFDAPAQTVISRIQLWRHGQSVRADGADGGGDEWDVFAQTDDGSLSLEGCVVPEGQASCNVGAPEDLNGKGLSKASLATYDLDTAWALWGVTCNPSTLKNCPTANGLGYPYGSFNLWGSIVTIRDDVKPGLAVGGGLWAEGWRRPGDALTYDASDNAGIKAVHAQVGSVTAAASGSCDYRRPAPCGGRLSGSLALATAPPDGPQPASVTAIDAAGNETTTTRTVHIDGNAPAVDLRPPRRRNIVVSAKDYASGFAAGQIAVRNSAAEPHRALPTTYRRGKLRARLDRGNPRKVDVVVTVRDNAGNEITGAPARFRITSVTSQRLRAKVRRGGRVRVKFGRKVTIRGQLVLSGRRPVAGVPITVVTRPRVRGAGSAVEATGTVGPNGRFAITLPRGPARDASITYPGGAGFIPAERRLRLMVPASSTIKASRLRLNGAGLVRFRGRVRGGAGADLVVVLQGKEGGRWRTFADTRTGKGGRWRASYRFSGLPGAYPIRARIRRQADLPYETGVSKRVTVHVG
jgi:hypothetical protein